MRIAIGSDRSGFALKEALKAHLAGRGVEVEDLGLREADGFMAYYEVAPLVARAVQSGRAQRGVLVCGTGAGMCIAANKFAGVHAVAAESVYTAARAWIVNRANVLCLGGWVVAPEKARTMLEAWLDTEFGAGFDAERVAFLERARGEVGRIESEHFKPLEVRT